MLYFRRSIWGLVWTLGLAAVVFANWSNIFNAIHFATDGHLSIWSLIAGPREFSRSLAIIAIALLLVALTPRLRLTAHKLVTLTRPRQVRLLALSGLVLLALAFAAPVVIREIFAIHGVQEKYHDILITRKSSENGLEGYITSLPNLVQSQSFHPSPYLSANRFEKSIEILLNAPIYMHRDDSRLLTVWYDNDFISGKEARGAAARCSLHAPAFDVIFIPGDRRAPEKDSRDDFDDGDDSCTWVISAKSDGTQELVYTLHFLYPPQTIKEKRSRRVRERYVTDYVSVDVGESPLSGASVTKISGALGLLTALLALYLQASGKGVKDAAPNLAEAQKRTLENDETSVV